MSRNIYGLFVVVLGLSILGSYVILDSQKVSGACTAAGVTCTDPSLVSLSCDWVALIVFTPR